MDQVSRALNKIIKPIKTFLLEEDGPTAVEYAVLLMLVFLATIGIIQVLGGALDGSFGDSGTKINAATGS